MITVMLTFLNSPSLVIAQRSSVKYFAVWKCLALISSEEISGDMYSPQEYKKRFVQNVAGSISIGLPIAFFIVTFLTLKKQFTIKGFKAILSDGLLKPSPPFVLFPQCALPLLDNLMNVLSPPFKAKRSMNENLGFSSS